MALCNDLQKFKFHPAKLILERTLRPLKTFACTKYSFPRGASYPHLLIFILSLHVIYFVNPHQLVVLKSFATSNHPQRLEHLPKPDARLCCRRQQWAQQRRGGQQSTARASIVPSSSTSPGFIVKNDEVQRCM
jgi:hypothetical protein